MKVSITNRNLSWRITLYFAGSTILLPLVAGCGGTYNASVKGVVKLDDTPLKRGTVTFTPEQLGPSGYGLIDDSGSYSVKIGLANGIPSGQYIVTVAANEQSTPSADPALPPKPGKPVTPIWYRNPTNSPLKYTVNPGKNEINLDLKSQPPAGWKPQGRT